MRKRCKFCRSKFFTIDTRVECCSRSCAAKYRFRKSRIKKECPICKNGFIVISSRASSYTTCGSGFCKSQNQLRKVEGYVYTSEGTAMLNCLNCEQNFYLFPYEIRKLRYKPKFCKHRCFIEFRKKHSKNSKKPVPILCDECGEKIMKVKYKIRSRNLCLNCRDIKMIKIGRRNKIYTPELLNFMSVCKDGKNCTYIGCINKLSKWSRNVWGACAFHAERISNALSRRRRRRNEILLNHRLISADKVS